MCLAVQGSALCGFPWWEYLLPMAGTFGSHGGSALEKGESSYAVPTAPSASLHEGISPMEKKALQALERCTPAGVRRYITLPCGEGRLPLWTGKAAAFPVVKRNRLCPRTKYLLGGHRYWCSEDHVSSKVSNEQKKCPESYVSGVFHRPRSLLLYVFSDGKGRKKSRNFQEISGLFFILQ